MIRIRDILDGRLLLGKCLRVLHNRKMMQRKLILVTPEIDVEITNLKKLQHEDFYCRDES